MKKILLVEDDNSLSFLLADNLEQSGYKVVVAADGEKAWNIFCKHDFDLVVCDVMLPRLDGFSLGEKMKQKNPEIPLIYLSARGEKDDRIKGLKLGADDYMTKPFSIEELELRILIALKRIQNTPNSIETSVEIDNAGLFKLDYLNLTLEGPDGKQRLTPKEASLLKLFFQHPNQVLKRDQILIKLWGRDDYFLGRSLDVFISRLRKYIQSDSTLKITNIPTIGFRFDTHSSDFVR
jgi:DNA-binding response OmpR family regulator